MKTFGELEIGDILYSINDMNADWGEVTKHKITGITKYPLFVDIEIADYYNDGASIELHERKTGTIGMLAPTLEGVKKYWELEYTDAIKKQEAEIASLQADLKCMKRSLELALNATE